MTPPPAKKCKKSAESSGWKKPASNGNRYLSSGPVLRSMCLFFKLPLEIRLMIYSELVKVGKLDFLRCCQRIHGEALEVVSRDSISLVVECGGVDPPSFYYRKGREVHRREPISDKIQHLKVYIYTDPENYGVKHDEIDHFGAHYPELKNPKISRKNCWIRLRYDGLLRKPSTERLTNFLGVFREFDNVFLNITYTFTSRYRKTYVHEPRRSIAIAEFESWFKSLGISLEPFAGPLKWHDNPDREKRYWEFHPRYESQRE